MRNIVNAVLLRSTGVRGTLVGLFQRCAQGWTFSTGAAYTFNADREWATEVSTDILFGSGLRTTVVTPNDLSLPNYAVVNASLMQKIPIGLGKGNAAAF
jgi:hypothetical protein